LDPQENLRCKVLDAVGEIWKEAGKKISLRTSGKSMWPLLREGEEVVLVFQDGSRLQRGDIAALRLPGSIIVHRVVAVDRSSGKIFEKGDNNMYVSAASPEQILGKVIEIRSGGRTFHLEKKTWRVLGLLLCYSGLAAVRIYGFVRDCKNKVWTGSRGGWVVDLARRSVHSLLLVPSRLLTVLGRALLR
jgi:signal peptidase